MADVKISELPNTTVTGEELVPMNNAGNQTSKAKSREISKIGYQTIVDIADTSSTLALTHIGAWLRYTAGGDSSVIVPTNANVAFPVGTTLNGVRAGTGELTISGESGVTINKPSTQTMKLRSQFSTFMLIKISTNSWDLMGDLGATP